MKTSKNYAQTSRMLVGNFHSFLVALCVAFTFISCQKDLDQEVSPNLTTIAESLIVKTGIVHEEEGFFFLAPIVKSTSYSGTFDASLAPVVEICSTPTCDPTLKTIYTVDGSGSEKVRVDLENEHYIVNWNTMSTGAVAGQTYRVSVKINERVLGYFDVAIVSTGAQAKSVASGVTALVSGQTLPIKFRVEDTDDGGVQVPGRDIVVFNDMNMFDNTAMQNTNNVRLVKNLVNFTTSGARNAGNVVWMDRGRNARCFSNTECNNAGWATMMATISAEGFTIENIFSTAGSLINIPTNVKVIFLVMPTLDYTTDEVNSLKQFAAEGGRIVFVGEYDGFYLHIPVQNQLLISLGAVLRNTGGAVDCSYNTLPTASIRQHPITEGITDLTIACASVIEPGAQDYALFYDKSNTLVLAGVAKIDVTPIAAQMIITTARTMSSKAQDENLNPNSAKGR
jgi:hypothetical protein